MSASFNPYTKRQSMIEPDYEVYRYRSTYMNEVELHHHDFYEVYLLLRGLSGKCLSFVDIDGLSRSQENHCCIGIVVILTPVDEIFTFAFQQ